MTEKGGYRPHLFGTIFNQKPIQQIIKKTVIKKHGIGYQRDPKRERKSMPKVIKNQCQKW